MFFFKGNGQTRRRHNRAVQADIKTVTTENKQKGRVLDACESGKCVLKYHGFMILQVKLIRGGCTGKIISRDCPMIYDELVAAILFMSEQTNEWFSLNNYIVQVIGSVGPFYVCSCSYYV